MTSRSRRFSAAWGAVVTGVFTQAAAAADVGYGVDVGAGYTDNIAREAEGGEGEAIATLGGQLRLDHESRRLAAKVNSRLELREYLDDSYDSEIVGNLNADARFNIIEERFSWTLSDTFGQTLRNQLSAATPDNRESVNFLSTGPDFTLPLGERDKLRLHGRYIDVHYEDSELGSQRVRAEANLLHELSNAAEVSLNANTEQISFDDDQLFTDFDLNEAFLSYRVDAARTTLSLDGGVAEVRSDDGMQDAWLGRLNAVRRVSSSLSIGIEMGHELTEAGNAFVQLQQMQPGVVDPVTVQQTSLPFENTYGTIFTRFSRQRTGINFRASHFDEQYEGLPLFDRKRLLLEGTLSRDLNAAISVHVGVTYNSQEYEALDRELTDVTGRLGMRWNVGRVTSVNVDYQYLDRRDNQDLLDYDASELWVRFAYQVGGSPRDGGYGGL